MALMEWKDSYRVGVPAVDHEHRELIAMINYLHQRLGENPRREDIVDSLGDIHAAISAHFALEEKIMRDAGYKGYEAHKADHEQLLDAILDIADDVAGGDAMTTLGKRLSEWFGNHFRTMDAELHKTLG